MLGGCSSPPALFRLYLSDALMPRRLPGLRSRPDARSRSPRVAYGEVGSSIYFALGIVALFALGLTPWVLLGVGRLFMLVALSYAEGTAAIPETGGAAMLARRAFNDPIGFLTGWVLLLDYAIVIALAALFAPHYFGHAVGWERLTRHPWDVVAAVFIILAITLLRLIRRPGLYRIAVVVAVVALVSQRATDRARLRVPLLVPRPEQARAPRASRRAGTDSPSRCRWRCSPTRASRRSPTSPRRRASPGRRCRAACSSASARRGARRRFAGRDRRVPRVPGRRCARRRLAAGAARRDRRRRSRGTCRGFLVDCLRVLIGLSGRGDPARGRDHVDLGHRAGRLLARPPPDAAARVRHVRPPQHALAARRSSAPPPSRARSSILAASIGNEVTFLASLYSFGVLITFAIAQARSSGSLHGARPRAAVPRRRQRADRGRPVPVAALLGSRSWPRCGSCRSPRTTRRGSAGRRGCCSAPRSMSARAAPVRG